MNERICASAGDFGSVISLPSALSSPCTGPSLLWTDTEINQSINLCMELMIQQDRNKVSTDIAKLLVYEVSGSQ